MRKVFVIGALLVSSATALPAAAARGPYVGLAGGVSIVHNGDMRAEVPTVGSTSANIEYKAGSGVNVSAGYKLDQVRLEGEFGYSKRDIDNGSALAITPPENSQGDLRIKSYMFNGFYDIVLPSPVYPFLGVGVGAISGKFKGLGEDIEDTVAGYQLTAGVTVPVSTALNIDLYYRYQGTSSDFKEHGASLSYDNSLIFAAVRYTFNR